jgi:hypothetical protein
MNFILHFAGILNPFTQVERLSYKKRIRNLSLDNPAVFIIGFWRIHGGSTLSSITL